MKFLIALLTALPLLAVGETLLFVDDHEILYRPATKRVLHQPQRHAGNPFIVGPVSSTQSTPKSSP